MNINLNEKIAIVTGASKGIGRETALALAACGARVLVLARNLDLLTEVVSEIEAKGGSAAAYACDVSDSEDMQRVLDTILKDSSRIDILVNNAGITRDRLLLRMKEEDWDAVLQTNLKSVFFMTKIVSRRMLKQRSGSIINISSVVGISGNAGQANYAASKAGIIGFTQSIAKEFGARGIRCNAVAPGLIETDMTQEISQEIKDVMQKNISLNRLGTASDVASVIAFLASDLACYITGQVIVVDGGMN